MTKFSHFILLSLFTLFLVFPIYTLNGAASGLLLWYNIVLPTLFPFIVITSLIIKTNAFSLISNFIGLGIGKFFSVSKDSSLAIIVGFLCGYPMGAKVINDLYQENAINIDEAKYLLSFCNNSSPMFIISFFVLQILNDSQKLIPVLFSLYAAPILLSFFTRKIYLKDSKKRARDEVQSTKRSLRFSFSLLDDSIIDSITLILKIGGYIIIFSILIHLLSILFSGLRIIELLLPLFEITNGLSLYNLLPNNHFQYLQMIFLVSMGGFCAIGQTQCVIDIPGINMIHYSAQKIITAIIAVIINMFIYLISQNIHLVL